MKPPRKWEPSEEQVLTGDDLMKLASDDCVVYVSRMFNGQPRSARYVVNMAWSVVIQCLATGRIFKARVREEYREWARKEAS